MPETGPGIPSYVPSPNLVPIARPDSWWMVCTAPQAWHGLGDAAAHCPQNAVETDSEARFAPLIGQVRHDLTLKGSATENSFGGLQASRHGSAFGLAELVGRFRIVAPEDADQAEPDRLSSSAAGTAADQRGAAYALRRRAPDGNSLIDQGKVSTGGLARSGVLIMRFLSVPPDR